jgi:tetratricopeptide (TPR) repeat protein
LVRRSPGNGELIFDHAQSVFWVGYLDWRLGNFADAERAFVEYLSLASQLGKSDPENVNWRAEAGHANINLGVYSLETAGPSAAVPYFQNGLAIFRAAAEFEPDNIEWQSQIAQSHAWLADAYQNAGSLSRAGDERGAEQEIYRQLLTEDPANRDAQLSLINSNRARAEILLQRGRIEEAIVDLQEAKEYGDQLIEFEPDNGLARQFLAGIYANLGEAVSHTSDTSASLALFAQARQIAAELTQVDETVLEWRLLRYRVALQHLKYMVDNSQIRDVHLLAELNGTALELRQLGSETPEASEIFHLFAVANYLTATLLRSDGRSAERSIHIRATIDTLEPLRATLPPRMQAVLAMAYRENGDQSKTAKLAAQLARIEFSHPGYSLGQ